MISAPAYDTDYFSDAFIADPYPHYRAMRDLGPAVWLPRNDAYAITRFADVRDALRNDRVFRSGQGVMLNEPTNRVAGGTSVLNMDEPQHSVARRPMAKPLLPAALAPLRGEIEGIAARLVDALVAGATFDGVRDFAHVLPLDLVTRLVGLPEAGRVQMLGWAAGIFDTMGNINARFEEGAKATAALLEFIAGVAPAELLPGSWGARLFDLVEAGELDERTARGMIFDYSVPALDTTINATSSTLWYLGRNPDQWAAVRDEPSLLSAAIEEGMRLETPIRSFSRLVAEDANVDGVTIPAGSRALIVYASANRDERRWSDPDRFDIRRRAPQEQLAFGTGIHMCAGMHLARLEMRCLFEAFARRVARFEVGDATYRPHQLLRGPAHFTVRIIDAAH